MARPLQNMVPSTMTDCTTGSDETIAWNNGMQATFERFSSKPLRHASILLLICCFIHCVHNSACFSWFLASPIQTYMNKGCTKFSLILTSPPTSSFFKGNLAFWVVDKGWKVCWEQDRCWERALWWAGDSSRGVPCLHLYAAGTGSSTHPHKGKSS